MHLEQAQTLEDWKTASAILMEVMHDLDRQGTSLWAPGQLSVCALQYHYQEGELYLAKNLGSVEGVIFLQEQDTYFWPELNTRDSLFIHKLAIRPELKGQAKGSALIALAEQEAKRRGLQWLRLDCDDREPLHRFYRDNGFAFVDVKQMENFNVARYEKYIST